MIHFITQNEALAQKFQGVFNIISPIEGKEMMSRCSILQLDTETSGLDPHIDNLLLCQFGNKRLDFQIVIDCCSCDITFFKDTIENTVLIGHNLKFDLQFMYKYNIIPRKVYDTMIAEQVLFLSYPDFAHKYSLKELLHYYLDLDMDKSVRDTFVNANGNFTADQIIYAAKDVEYLEDIMLRQLAEGRKKECIKGIQLEVLTVPSMAYLEWCGIKLSEERWKKKMEKDNNERISSLQNLNLFLLKESKLNKFISPGKQMSLFDDEDDNSSFEYEGRKYTSKINWSSSQQVIKVAKILGFNTVTQDKNTGEDKDSVLEKHLSQQKGINDEFLKLYFNYQEFTKKCSSFGQGHLNAINPITGRIHTSYKQIGTISSRMSCGSNKSNTSIAKLRKLNPEEVKYPKRLGSLTTAECG